MHLARDENVTTFHAHSRGVIVGLIVNEFGIARTVTAAIEDAFEPGQAA